MFTKQLIDIIFSAFDIFPVKSKIVIYNENRKKLGELPFLIKGNDCYLEHNDVINTEWGMARLNNDFMTCEEPFTYHAFLIR